MTTAPAFHNMPLDYKLPVHQRTTRPSPPETTQLIPRFIADELVVQNPDRGGWIAAEDLLSGERLGALLDHPQRLWDTPPHAAAVLAWRFYSYRLAQPLAAAWAAGREIPVLSADNVMVQILPSAPYIAIGLRRGTSGVLATSPASRAPGAVVLPDEAAQLDFFRSTLIDGHLQPLVQRTKEVHRVGERSLWGQAAAAIAYAFADVSTSAMLDTALFTGALPFPDLAGVGEDETVWRITCCLSFASPGLTACSNCVTRNRQRSRKLPNPMARLRRRGEQNAEH